MLEGQHIGPFEIEAPLGSGAMGTVYKAMFHRGPDKVIPVALKVVALGLLGNEGAMARFEREASILKQLRHPNIVRLIAHGKINKSNPYIAMEFIDGEPLDRVLARRGKLGWEEVAAYGKQLALALQYAHEKGIIHRDLKPSNLMLSTDATLKLTDFGIAKDTDVTALTGANSTIGTAAYMSPEQCKGDRNLSNKSDLYSLGIVFYELLTGRKPFTAETTVEMFLKHVNEPAPRVRQFAPDLPPRFEGLILKLLAKDTEERPVDAAWVARVLGDIEQGEYDRKSAGLAAAEARNVKKVNQSGEKMDEADREAARALRGKKKRAKKAEAVPFWERKSVRAAGFSLVLLLLAAGVYLAVRPPSAEKMFRKIEAAESATDRADRAREFLEAHGASGGELVEQAARVFRDATVAERNLQLNNRSDKAALRKPTEGDDPEAYESAMLAIDAEKAGDFPAAEALWAKVRGRFPDEAALPYTTDPGTLAKARWGWVADKRLADLKAARAESARLAGKVNESRLNDTPIRFDRASPESLALRAHRLFQPDLDDREKAYRVGDELIALTDKDPAARVWYLVAHLQRFGKGRPAPAEALAVRLQRLRGEVNVLEGEVARALADPGHESFEARKRDARFRARKLAELYDDEKDPQIKDLVDKAAKVVEPIARK